MCPAAPLQQHPQISTVLVCVPTYRRPDGLRRALHSLAEGTASSRVEATVLVLDNEPAESTVAIVRQMTADYPVPLDYVAVLDPGIAAVRNASLDAGGAYDAIAFLDDDEVAPAGWLDGLVEGLERHGADVGVGPVAPAFEGVVPDWIADGRCVGFDRADRPEGTVLPWCATNNTIMRRSVIDLVPEGFDARYGLTGGSDSMYFYRATRAGARIVWLEDVVVTEFMPADRARPSWLLRRAYRAGTIRSRIERDVLGVDPRLAIRAAKGVANVPAGLTIAARALATGDRAGALNGLQRVAAGLGTLAGLIGLRYVEYRRDDHDSRKDTAS